MQRKESLILLQSASALTGAVCGRSLKGPELRRLRRVPCTGGGPQALRAALGEVLEALGRESAQGSAGGRAGTASRPRELRLCLAADAALFRDWDVPLRSRAKARQAVSLLLESEFPCEPASLAQRICFTGRGSDGKGLRAVSVSLPKALLEAWREALEEAALRPALITVEPFPLLLGLPGLSGASLFLQVEPGQSVLAALDGNSLRRVSVLENNPDAWGTRTGGDPVSSLARAAASALDGLDLVPQRLLLCGSGLAVSAAGSAARDVREDAASAARAPERDGAAVSRRTGKGGAAEESRSRQPAPSLWTPAMLGEAFGLPALVLGRDLPLPPAAASGLRGIGGPEASSALCLAGMPLPGSWRRRAYPAFQEPSPFLKNARPGAARIGRLLPAAICLLCAFFAFLFSIWAEGHARWSQALELERQTAALYRKALPETRGVVSPARMKSILESRNAALRGARDAMPSFPVLHLLSAMHAAAPDAPGTRIDRLSLDPKRCRISGSATGYEAVNTLREAFSGLPGVVGVNIVGATGQAGSRPPSAAPATAGSVRFELDLLRGEES